jgi:hypothetical protein
MARRYRSPRRFANAERIGHDFTACWHGPVTQENRGIPTALLTAFREICELRPSDWGELVQAHDDREAVQVSPDDLPVIDIHSL